MGRNYVMRNFIFRTVRKILQGEKIKQDEHTESWEEKGNAYNFG
jgi:hypothetical protein